MIRPHWEEAFRSPRNLDYQSWVMVTVLKESEATLPRFMASSEDDSLRSQSSVDKFVCHCDHTQSAGQCSTAQTDYSHYQLLLVLHLSTNQWPPCKGG